MTTPKLGLWLAGLSPRATAASTAALTATIEFVTLALRFGLGLQAHTSTSWLAPLTFGYRVHHGYLGMLVLVAAALVRRGPAIRNVLVIAGGALLLSDVIHHLLVLWPVTGSPEFYVRYGED